MKGIACLGRKEFHHGASRPDSSWMEYYLVNSHCYVIIIRCPVQKRHEWFIIFVQRKQCGIRETTTEHSRSIGKKEHWNTGNNTTGNIWCFECRTNTTFTVGRQDGFVYKTRSRLSPLGASIGANLTGWRHQNSTIAGFSLTTGNYFHEHFQWKLKLISNFSNCKDAWKKIHAFFCKSFIYSCMK